MKRIVYKGKIWLGEDSNDHESVYVGYNNDALSERFTEDGLNNKNISVRYWISDVELDKDKLKEQTLLALSGSLQAAYYTRYSDYTGYLWTTDELQVGGHDLKRELEHNAGKFLYMEVDKL